MRVLLACAVLSLSSCLAASSLKAQTVAHVGHPAVPFSLTGSDGKSHALADYAGKFVVLEWTNPDCPFVKKFYDSGTMQKLQKEYVDKGVVWIRIDSGAPGHDPELMHFSYKRYLENRIRETYSFEGTPLRIDVRKAADKERDK